MPSRKRHLSLMSRLMVEQRGRCHWCNCKVRRVGDAKGNLPHDAATLDHLIPRLSPVRSLPPQPGEKRYVVACYRCNNERGHRDCTETFRAEQARRTREGGQKCSRP